jgi:DNA-binding NtrC family response regulator
MIVTEGTSKPTEYFINRSGLNHNGIFKPDRFERVASININKPKRILIVDDDDSIRDLVSIFLTALKFDIKAVDNAYDAMDLFTEKAFDLILTDIEMPGMDGLELALNIKKTSPETPVILITGMDKAQIDEAMKKGLADSVLYKPFDLKHLEASLYSFLKEEW